MSSYTPAQYRAYTAATGTVAKTRQLVMLYDGIIKCLKYAEIAARENRIEDRYNQLIKASEIVMALQSSIDFDKGGDIAGILHEFYTQIARRIISVNFLKDAEKAGQLCLELLEEVKQMRNVWDDIDRSLTQGTQPKQGESQPVQQSAPAKPESKDGSGITISA
ncbi:MAG TPA: flagellar export chaperone FliS [Rickettsiales bacterium]|nr:flagellar export chaperone FliS [Rickettsiales bacterium]